MTTTEVPQAESSVEIIELPAQSTGQAVVEFNQKQVALLKRTLCRPRGREATNDELALFIGMCKRARLDPFQRQIYAVFRRNGQSGHEEMTIQVGIDGFRAIAERTGRYAGQAGPWWCDENGAWSEFWPHGKTPPYAARVVVKKMVGGQTIETPAVAHWAEYAVTGKGGQMWAAMPANQLAKCAEALALRKAFPNELSGMYVEEEMNQADIVDSTATLEDTPTPEQRIALRDLFARSGLTSAEQSAVRVWWTRSCGKRAFDRLTPEEAGELLAALEEDASAQSFLAEIAGAANAGDQVATTLMRRIGGES